MHTYSKRSTDSETSHKAVPLAGATSDPLHEALNRRATVQAQMQLGETLNNTGLPDDVKSGIESLSGTSLDDVRVHYNSGAPAQLNAAAYTQSTDIHVAPGQEQHLAHEAWHVVQQKQGRVQPTMQMHGVGVNDDHGLEKEADVMGERATQIDEPAQRMALDDEDEEPAQMMSLDDEEETAQMKSVLQARWLRR
jgi:hypothetical protein